jgi:putative ABC transport system permease protein
VLPDLTINPWPEVEATFYQSMQADKRGNRFTLLIVVFIVFIGVLNTVLMSVLERTREFGVLKAIGSRPSTIASLILFETMMLAGISIVIGGLLATPVIAWFAWRGIALPEPIDMGGIAFGFMTGEFSLAVFAWPALVVLLFAAAVSIPPGIRATRIAPTQAMGSF